MLNSNSSSGEYSAVPTEQVQLPQLLRKNTTATTETKDENTTATTETKDKSYHSMLGHIISYLSTTSPPEYDNQQWQNKRIAKTVKEHKTAAKKNDESEQISDKGQLKRQIEAYIDFLRNPDSSNLNLSERDESNNVKTGMEYLIYLKQHTQTEPTKIFIEKYGIPLKNYIREYDRVFHDDPSKQKNLNNLEKRFKVIYGVSYQEYQKID